MAKIFVGGLRKIHKIPILDTYNLDRGVFRLSTACRTIFGFNCGPDGSKFQKNIFFFSKLVNIFSLGCYEPQILLWHNVRYWINRRSTVFVRLDVVGSTGVFFLVRRHIWTASARHASPGAK